jgi:hypothetical protein
MAVVDLFQPVVSGGIRNTNFFNGRLLTAEDLSDFQSANTSQHQQLARSAGEGIVYGFDVTVSSSSPSQVVLHVTQGLAFNRNNKAVKLPTDIDLELVPAADAQNAEAGQFAVCQPAQQTLFTNPGLYILTAMPVSSPSTESAPKVEVLDQGVGISCASRWAVEGAKFRTVQLTLGENPDPSTLAGQAAQLATQLDPLLDQLVGATGATADQLRKQIAPLMSKFRNLVAHICFGTEKFSTFAANPFGRNNGDSLFAEYGALDDLRDDNLITKCDVPVALLYWTKAGLQFVDTWSVRRPIFPEASSRGWAPVSSRRRIAEGLAMFLQFQEQINEMLKAATNLVPLTSISASDYFAYLPAIGLLPLASAEMLTGFDYSEFFNAVTHRCAQTSDGLCAPLFIEGGKVEELVQRCLLYPAIHLSDQEMVWLYWTRENMQPSAASFRSYVIFTNGHVPNEGLAQFDLNYWNYANFV